MGRYRFFFEIVDGVLAARSISDSSGGIWSIGLLSDDSGQPEPVRIWVGDRTATLAGLTSHQAVMVRADLVAPSFDEGVDIASLHVDALVTMTTFDANVTAGDVRLVLGCDMTPEAQTTEFLQVKYLDVGLFQARRPIDTRSVEALLRRNPTADSRVARALRWYRAALSKGDPFDAFTLFWMGLENLNEPLMERVGELPEERNCASCGAPYVVPTNRGVRALFAQYSAGGTEDFRRCRNLRVDLLHGHGALDEAAEIVEECAETCRKLVRIGVNLLLGVPEDEVRLDPPVVKYIRPARVEYRGHFHISPSALARVPMLELGEFDFEIEESDGQAVARPIQEVASTVPVMAEYDVTLLTETGQRITLGHSRLEQTLESE
jgi:hypothetical protein